MTRPCGSGVHRVWGQESVKGMRPGLALHSFFAVLGLNASHTLDKHFPTELHPQALWPIVKDKTVLLRPLVSLLVPPSAEFSRDDAKQVGRLVIGSSHLNLGISGVRAADDGHIFVSHLFSFPNRSHSLLPLCLCNLIHFHSFMSCMGQKK